MEDFSNTCRFGEDLDKEGFPLPMDATGAGSSLIWIYQFLHGSIFSCCLWGPFSYSDANKLQENEGTLWVYMFSVQGSAYREFGFPGTGGTSSLIAPPKSQISQGCQI